MLTSVPSTATLVMLGLISHLPCAIDAVAVMAPFAAFRLAMRASPPRLANFGSAVAARMPRITITTISSISVKPPCAPLVLNLFIVFLSVEVVRMESAFFG